ncbi:flagellar biosynthesis anti-sigma factor FlgM [Syntrophomonas palmitatica]|uniref:flagellar biosynthesis anti-sigma factor FlgM n=1 Tax=Syntrophomonas palmitatica TaxID=402877 RepID=UPI0006D1026B|nr:flagellar biosynthesis anti-sigma factor FlgM [Syntrophomonas palmitatica]
MFVSRTQLQNILKIYGKSSANTSGVKPAANKSIKNDELALSRESKITQKAVLAAKQAEDLRPELVAHLQEKIFAGTYTVSDDEVAEKIIDTAILDRLI